MNFKKYQHSCLTIKWNTLFFFESNFIRRRAWNSTKTQEHAKNNSRLTLSENLAKSGFILFFFHKWILWEKSFLKAPITVCIVRFNCHISKFLLNFFKESFILSKKSSELALERHCITTVIICEAFLWTVSKNRNRLRTPQSQKQRNFKNCQPQANFTVCYKKEYNQCAAAVLIKTIKQNMVIYKKIKKRQKSEGKKRNILKIKRAFKKKFKVFFIIFNGSLTVFIELDIGKARVQL